MTGYVEGAKSASRVLTFLEIVVESDQSSVSLAEIARLTNSDVTTAYRTMRVLERFGYVHHESEGRNYSIGRGLIAMAARVMGKIDLQTLAREVMFRVRNRTNETISLHIPTGKSRVCVASLESPNSIRRIVPVGDRVPTYAGPTGKVILAHLEEREREEILRGAAADGKDPELIRAHLREAREKGYLAMVGDRTEKVGGLSVPVFDKNGIVAAFTVSGPADRWGNEAMEAAAPDVVEDVRGLSRELGYLG